MILSRGFAVGNNVLCGSKALPGIVVGYSVEDGRVIYYVMLVAGTFSRFF